MSENPEDLDHAELRERIVALEEELDAMEAEPLERAEKELALAQIWGAVGQPNREIGRASCRERV